MDKLTFEKYLNYRPKIYEHIIYWIMMVIYMASFILAMLLSNKYFPVFQNHLYNKGNDIIFSMYATGIFSLSFFFFSLVVNFVIIVSLFSIVPAAQNIALWYEVAGSKTYNYDIYKKKNRRNIVFMIVILIFSIFFSFISTFVHLRINSSGIYYTKIFEFTEKYYKWDELKSVSVYNKVTRTSKGKKNLSPEMILEFGENRLDIWDGAGLGSPNSDVIIKVIALINENAEIIIDVDNNFTDETLDLLYNSCTDWKRNNIINVFSYLDKKR